MKQKGFTLAEVLITLAIIGIVAALTIPSVISNYQQQEFKTGLKKAVSVLNEAIQTNIAQDGETPYDNIKQIGSYNTPGANGNLYEYLKRHMSIIKEGAVYSCNQWRVWQGKDQCTSSSSGNKVFYTTDGMRFEFPQTTHEIKLHESDVTIGRPQSVSYSWGPYHGDNYYYNGSCGSYGLNNNHNNTTQPPCLVMVDVNGDRKPNSPSNGKTGQNQQDGRDRMFINAYTYPSPADKKLQDIFTIMITDEKAIPFGVVAQRAMYSSK